MENEITEMGELKAWEVCGVYDVWVLRLEEVELSFFGEK